MLKLCPQVVSSDAQVSGAMNVSIGCTPVQHDGPSRRFLALLSEAAKSVRAKKEHRQQNPRGDL